MKATVDLSGFDPPMRGLIAGMQQFPKDRRNPLLEVVQDYRGMLRTLYDRRPAISASGSFDGQPWAGFSSSAFGPNGAYLAYERGKGATIGQLRSALSKAFTPSMLKKAGGNKQRVPVWGDVERWRIGRVTNLGGLSVDDKGRRIYSQRYGLTRSERNAGYGSVRFGQTFTGPTVMGKLRKDGTRYKREDKQLGRGKRGGLLQDWLTSKPVQSTTGKTVTVTTDKEYAAVQAERRPFTWGPHIADFTGRMMQIRIGDFLKNAHNKGWK